MLLLLLLLLLLSYLWREVALRPHEEPGENEPEGVAKRESVTEAAVVVHGAALVRRHPRHEEENEAGQDEGDQNAQPHLRRKRHEERQNCQVRRVQIRGSQVLALKCKKRKCAKFNFE